MLTPAQRTTHLILGTVLLVWTLFPVYHLVLMSLTPLSQTYSGAAWPSQMTFDNYLTVFAQGHHFLSLFWRQLFNSLLVAVSSVAIVLFLASLASFSISRLKTPGGGIVSDISLATYLIPAAFLVVPLYRTMTNYNLIDTQAALIISIVAFASPYAIVVMKQAADKLPVELDESARIDGATAPQLFLLVYLPLMKSTLVAIGTYAFLLAWNEYLLALIMLSRPEELTLPVAAGLFLSSDDAPWNLLMATGVVYSLPPLFIYWLFRRYMVSGALSGAVKA